MELRQTWRVMNAVLWALSDARLPDELVDAQAATEAEAARLYYEANKRRE